MDGCLLIHGIGCIVGAVYVLFLNDTTGESLDDIGLKEKTKERQTQTTRIWVYWDAAILSEYEME